MLGMLKKLGHLIAFWYSLAHLVFFVWSSVCTYMLHMFAYIIVYLLSGNIETEMRFAKLHYFYLLSYLIGAQPIKQTFIMSIYNKE